MRCFSWILPLAIERGVKSLDAAPRGAVSCLSPFWTGPLDVTSSGMIAGPK
jgi:hypothetical protein